MPKSPFDDNFDGKVGDVVEGQAVDGAVVHPAANVAPPAPKASKAVAPPVAAPRPTPAPVAAAPVAMPVPANPAIIDQNILGQLLNYLILKEGREAASQQAELDRIKHIQKQRDRNAKEQDSKILLKQARCKHLKGGRRGTKTQNRDYAVYQFQFIDFSEYIRCRICGMKWFRRDTVDHLIRLDKNGNERKISNHTKAGWREALDMCESSTDTMATSERVPNIAPNATDRDKYGLEFENRFVDKETGEAIEGVTI